jgi:hypothetical protein
MDPPAQPLPIASRAEAALASSAASLGPSRTFGTDARNALYRPRHPRIIVLWRVIPGRVCLDAAALLVHHPTRLRSIECRPLRKYIALYPR